MEHLGRILMFFFIREKCMEVFEIRDGHRRRDDLVKKLDIMIIHFRRRKIGTFTRE